MWPKLGPNSAKKTPLKQLTCIAAVLKSVSWFSIFLYAGWSSRFLSFKSYLFYHRVHKYIHYSCAV